jgi:hypothetical protein
MIVLFVYTEHSLLARRKQGGSQSVNDNSKGAAISAGAMLRRYGEQALRDVSEPLCLFAITKHILPGYSQPSS